MESGTVDERLVRLLTPQVIAGQPAVTPKAWLVTAAWREFSGRDPRRDRPASS